MRSVRLGEQKPLYEDRDYVVAMKYLGSVTGNTTQSHPRVKMYSIVWGGAFGALEITLDKSSREISASR